MESDPWETEVKDRAGVAAWYRGRGDPAAVAELTHFLHWLLPGLSVNRVTGAACVTAKTPDKVAPYIDEAAPGLYVAAGGCGYAAKSCDEIGRVAAVLAVEQSWDSNLPRQACRLQFSGVK